ncbi:hypothetical protein BB560_006358 [Smittium megazygosporum]|uniref:Uncharacterized protein n=1 Tax=Smittium megazygosporum TaxID=133381 RepID=A0A2T9Y8A7_9FUNG|nr:hypothetical protein BB560_006358 [Smittium megazygosporum]
MSFKTVATFNPGMDYSSNSLAAFPFSKASHIIIERALEYTKNGGGEYSASDSYDLLYRGHLSINKKAVDLVIEAAIYGFNDGLVNGTCVRWEPSEKRDANKEKEAIKQYFGSVKKITNNRSQLCLQVSETIEPSLLTQDLVDSVDFINIDYTNINNKYYWYKYKRTKAFLDEKSKSQQLNAFEDMVRNKLTSVKSYVELQQTLGTYLYNMTSSEEYKNFIPNKSIAVFSSIGNLNLEGNSLSNSKGKLVISTPLYHDEIISCYNTGSYLVSPRVEFKALSEIRNICNQKELRFQSFSMANQLGENQLKIDENVLTNFYTSGNIVYVFDDANSISNKKETLKQSSFGGIGFSIQDDIELNQVISKALE